VKHQQLSPKVYFNLFLVSTIFALTGFFDPALAGAQIGFQITFLQQIKTLKTEADIAKGREDFGKPPAAGATTLTATLWANLLSLDDGTLTRIYDFDARKLYVLDPVKKAYQETSLFAEIGGRAEELNNRLYIRKALAAGGQSLVSFDVFQLETLFGIHDPDQKNDIAARKKTGSDTWDFIAPGGELVTRCQMDSAQALKGLKTAWNRFLIYGCQFHPTVFSFIANDGRLVKNLWYQTRNMDAAKQVSLTLVKTEEVQGPDDSWKKTYQLAPDCAADLWKVIEKARSVQAPEALNSQKTTQDFMEKAVKQGRIFDAYLACLECYLQTGLDMTAAQKPLLSKLDTDKNFSLFQKGLNNQTQDDAKKSVLALKSIDRKGLSRDYLIDIMLGDAYGASGDREAGVQSFLKALGKNPLLAGGWKDLGDSYYNSFDCPSAWLCWDTARGFYPDHPLLQSVTDMETSIVKQFPDYF